MRTPTISMGVLNLPFYGCPVISMGVLKLLELFQQAPGIYVFPAWHDTCMHNSDCD